MITYFLILLLQNEGAKQQLDPLLLEAVVWVESRGKVGAQSSAGAVGLMQIKPSTARWIGSTGSLLDPEVNISAGAKYLKTLIKKFKGSLTLALVAYNRGPSRVKQELKEGILELGYARKVLSVYSLLQLENNRPLDCRPTLQAF